MPELRVDVSDLNRESCSYLIKEFIIATLLTVMLRARKLPQLHILPQMVLAHNCNKEQIYKNCKITWTTRYRTFFYKYYTQNFKLNCKAIQC
jgi:hypothetical protein